MLKGEDGRNMGRNYLDGKISVRPSVSRMWFARFTDQ
jgi:hypothetical protein